jgi:hypothetical protein
LRERLKRASLLNTINRTIINYDREYLRDIENFETLAFSSVFSIPFLWAKTDYKGRKAVCKFLYYLILFNYFIRFHRESTFFYLATYYI